MDFPPTRFSHIIQHGKRYRIGDQLSRFKWTTLLDKKTENDVKAVKFESGQNMSKSGAMEKNPGCYIGDYSTRLCGDFKKPL